MRFNRWPVLLFLFGLPAAGAGYADDRHVGYYYPQPVSTEVYQSEVPGLPGTNRKRRIGFIVTVANAMFEKPYPPRVVLFAKGADAERLLIVALEDGVLDTSFRARADLACSQHTDLQEGRTDGAQLFRPSENAWLHTGYHQRW